MTTQALHRQTEPAAPDAPRVFESSTDRPASTRVEALLLAEAELRRAETEQALLYQIANGARRVTRFGAAFVFRRAANRRYRVVAASGMAAVDRSAPLIQELERLINKRETRAPADGAVEFQLPYDQSGTGAFSDYPLRAAVLIPAVRGERRFGAYLFLDDAPFSVSDRMVLERVAEVASHAWWAMGRGRRSVFDIFKRNAVQLAMATAFAACLAIPTPLVVLAPVEVAGRDPVRVGAPIAGVIEEVLIAPNAPVLAGQPLFRLNDVDLRADLELAAEEVTVAEARLRQIEQAALVDPRAKRELAVAAAELKLAEARRAGAAERLARAVVAAPAAGLALFADAQEWIGRPVAIGEQVMAVADPTHVEYRVDVPIDDAIAIALGAQVRVFLDADPLQPLDASIIRAAYEATEVPGGALAYRVAATPVNDATAGDVEPPRIGLRGVAQIYGETVSLGFWVFRRPIAWLRQNVGI